jgi:molybdopterin-binding protein
MYRLARVQRAFGGRVVQTRRGGGGHGGTQLTELGDRIVRRGFDAVELLAARPVGPISPPNLLRGTYGSARAPTVELPGGARLRVAFSGETGEKVSLLLDPESILLARKRFASSARNVLHGRVLRVEAGGATAGAVLLLGLGPLRLRVAITDEPIQQLHLRPGTPVWAYIKATALRRVDTDGERRPPSPAWVRPGRD